MAVFGQDPTLKEIFLQRSDEALDPIAKTLIRQWDEPMPTALQLLEVLDACVNGGLCSGLEITAMDLFLQNQLKEEGISMTTLLERATWRANY